MRSGRTSGSPNASPPRPSSKIFAEVTASPWVPWTDHWAARPAMRPSIESARAAQGTVASIEATTRVSSCRLRARSRALLRRAESETATTMRVTRTGIATSQKAIRARTTAGTDPGYDTLKVEVLFDDAGAVLTSRKSVNGIAVALTPDDVHSLRANHLRVRGMFH